jgi:hypothetical protein
VSALHITNGDDAGDKLRTFVDGPVTIAADVLHEGPCPPVDGDAWHDVRARFLASDGGTTYEEVRATLASWDAAIVDAAARGDEIVLWFEHDLFDQLLLIRTLDLVGRVVSDPARGGSPGPARPRPRVSLICIDRFPGIDRFIGLGQLTANQLATLTGSAVTVTRGHFRLAADAWRAFRTPDPSDLLQLAFELSATQLPVGVGGPALPFLGAALLRFLAELPSVANGLSQTETLALDVLLHGATDAGTLFRDTQAGEASPFMGDRTFFGILRRLASARVPLVALDAGLAGDDPRRLRVAITAAGRDVLTGRRDHIGLNGIDLWRGGVHLAGWDRSPWRWDARAETLVS